MSWNSEDKRKEREYEEYLREKNKNVPVIPVYDNVRKLQHYQVH